jgi:hypothetical protein
VAAGKNFLINGGFDIWQRGTSSTLNFGYGCADRWLQYIGTGTGTFAQESTVVPLGSRYSIKFTSSNASTNASITQYMETSTCSPFIGKTISVSVQVAASTSTAIALTVSYSTTVDAGAGSSWTTITATSGGTATPTSTTFVTLAGVYAVPSNANSIRVILNPSSNIGNGVVLYYGNAQLELGSVPTTFTRAGGTLQGELAACQRYYWQTAWNTSSTTTIMVGGFGISSTTVAQAYCAHPVTMRAIPSAALNGTANMFLYNGAGGGSSFPISAIAAQNSTTIAGSFNFTTSGITASAAYNLLAATAGNGYISFSAEL